jgi:hypothetical protein
MSGNANGRFGRTSNGKHSQIDRKPEKFSKVKEEYQRRKMIDQDDDYQG